MHFRACYQSSGSALLSALFLMTLVAIAATAMSTRLQLDIYRTRLSIQSDQAQLASQVVGFWTMDKLVNPLTKMSLLDDEGKVLDYPASMVNIYPNIKINGRVYDLQARFNLNNLQNTTYLPVFIRLMKNTITNVDMKKLNDIANATVLWINPYNPARGLDNIAVSYSKETPSYLPGYQMMQSISEFRLVFGVSSTIYRSLKPWITALPSITPININTASPQVLKALGNGLTDEQLNELLALRDAKGQFESKDIFILVSKFNIPAQQITIQSEYFMSVATVKSADLSFEHYLIFRRSKDKNGEFSVHLLSETLNAY